MSQVRILSPRPTKLQGQGLGLLAFLVRVRFACGYATVQRVYLGQESNKDEFSGVEMKVLLINGSPRQNGNTARALDEMIDVFKAEGIETELVRVGSLDVRGCIACGSCANTGACVFDDIVNEIAPAFEEADGLVVGSPVYYASANATLIALLDRLFFSTHFPKTCLLYTSPSPRDRG